MNEVLSQQDDVWILDSGSSRHLVSDESWLQNVESCEGVCHQPDGQPLLISKRGTVTINVLACGVERVLTLTDVYFAEGVKHNLISYGILDRKGYTLGYNDTQRVLSNTLTGAVDFDVQLVVNVLVVPCRVVDNDVEPVGVIMAVLGEEASVQVSSAVQKGSLMDFHKRFGHLNYETILKLAKDPYCAFLLTDKRREFCYTCSQGKQTKNKQQRHDSGQHSPIDRVGGVICSDIKDPMTPKDRLNNRYMINFVDHKSNYCRVFLARTKDAAAKKFIDFLIFFEKKFNCRVHILRTDSGGEYQNVDLFCKKSGVARQRIEARNQASN